MLDERSCPGTDRLTELLDGRLPAEEQHELATHLDGCEHCQETLQELASSGRSWEDIARHLRQDETAEAPSPELRRVVAELGGRGGNQTRAESGDSGDDWHAYLAATDRPDSLGRLGRYEVLELVGRGGMGVVLKALDPALQRVVAIKVMAPQLAASGQSRRRFEREAKAAAAVAHEHVVTIHEVSEFNGLPYMAMYYVAGVSLQERLDRSGPLKLEEVLRIGMQAASGLAAAHKQGLVHRDVKPGNILLENGVERVKLTDFGLARAVDDASVTQSGVIVGTPLYMSPEQARGEPVDHRSDLFSLGSVLYTICTDRPPFRAGGTLAVLKRVCEDTPRPIREINRDVPDWLCDIIAKLQAKDPAGRFQSAQELADLLGRHLAHLQQPSQVPMPARVRPLAPPTAAGGLWGVSAAAWFGVFLLALVIGAAVLDDFNFLIHGAQAEWTGAVLAGVAGAYLLLLLLLAGGEMLWKKAAPRAVLGPLPAKAGLLLGALVLIDAVVLSQWVGPFDRLRAFYLPSKKPPRPYKVPLRGRAELTLVSDDPDLLLTVEREAARPGEPIRHQISSSRYTLRTPPGRYRITATKDGATVFDELITLARGEKRTVRIKPQAGWVQLFNGKDLAGWVPLTGDAGIDPKTLWEVKGGELRSKKDRGNAYLRTVKQYENYTLALDFYSPNPDVGKSFSGLVLHLQEPGGDNSPAYLISLSSPQRDPIRVRRRTEGDWRAAIETSWKERPKGEWNTAVVTCRGDSIRLHINGEYVGEMAGCNLRKGYVGLQLQSHDIRFRNIRIKELPPGR